MIIFQHSKKTLLIYPLSFIRGIETSGLRRWDGSETVVDLKYFDPTCLMNILLLDMNLDGRKCVSTVSSLES